MRSGRWILVLVAAGTLAGCGMLGSGPFLSQAEAEAIAISQAPGTVDGIISARATTLDAAVGPNTNPGPPRSTPVWAVAMRGTFPPGSCGPVGPDGAPPRCPPPQHTALVVIDRQTGEFIMASVPADVR